MLSERVRTCPRVFEASYVSGRVAEAERSCTLYKAVRAPHEYAVTELGTVVTGLKLEKYYDGEIDHLGEEISQMGTEAWIRLPDEGLVEGCLYMSQYVILSRDWETNEVSESCVNVIKIGGVQ